MQNSNSSVVADIARAAPSAADHRSLELLVRRLVAQAIAEPGQGLPTPPDPLLSVAEVMVATGMSKSTLYGKIARGEFPRPVKLSARMTRWRRSAVQAYLDGLA